MAASEVSSTRQSDNLNTLLQEIDKCYTESDRKVVVIKFTKETLEGEFCKLPEDELFPYLKELQHQGRISTRKTDLLDYYGSSSNDRTIQEKIQKFKDEGTKYKNDGEDFVGREEDVDRILNCFESGHVKVLNLHGDHGVGKTTLADRVADIMKCKKMVKIKMRVDLRKMEKVDLVCFGVMHAFHYHKMHQQRPEMVFELIENLTEKAILILDNAEELIGEASFQDLLNRMVKHDKHSNLKIVLTSHVPLPQEYKSIGLDYKVDPLLDENANDLLKDLHLEDTVRKDIIASCRSNPLFLKATHAILKENLIKPQVLLANLKRLNAGLRETNKAKEMKQKQHEQSFLYTTDSNILSEAFDKFSPEMKEVAIKLSLFQRSFNLTVARKLLQCSDSNAIFYLCTLTDRNFIQVRKGKQYEMHPFVNKFLQDKCLEISFEKIYKEAKEVFCGVFLERLNVIASLLEKDYFKAYSLIEKDRPNFELALEISFDMEFLYFSSDYNEASLVAQLFECLLPGPGRERIFRRISETALKKGEWICYVNLVSMQMMVLLEKTTGKMTAQNLLEKVEEALGKVSDKLSDSYCLAESSYFYVKGEIAYSDFQTRKSRENAGKEALMFFEKSLGTRKKLLKDHTDTAYTLNAIGNCYMEMKEPEKALSCYTKALDMTKRLSGLNEHVHMPVYINQIAVYHETMGKRYKRESEQTYGFDRQLLYDQSKKEFEQALEKYQGALDLEKKLHLNGYQNTATFYRNMSNIYVLLENSDMALKTAKKALAIRKRVLGCVDTDTVRSYFQVGLIYERLGNINKSMKYFYKAYILEQSLPSGERSAVKERLIYKFESFGGNTEEAQEYDDRHVQALQGSGDVEILTSEDDDDSNDDSSKQLVYSDDESSSSSDLDYDVKSPKITPEKQEKTDQEKKTHDMLYEVTDRHALGKAAITWHVKQTGICVVFQLDTVLTETELSCQVTNQSKYPLPLHPVEALVSRVVCLESTEGLPLKKNFTLVIPHCGPSHTAGYELVIREYCEKSKTWREHNDFINIQEKSDLENYDVPDILSCIPAVLVTSHHPSMVCVTCRLVTDSWPVTPMAGRYSSTVFPDIQVRIEENTVKKETSLTMKVQPIPADLFNTNILCCGPVVHLDGFDPEGIHRPVSIYFAHPRARFIPENSYGKLRILYKNEFDGNEDWEDITDDPHVDVATPDGSKVCVRVNHLSLFWPVWIGETNTSQDIQVINHLKEKFFSFCRVPPVSAQFCVTESHQCILCLAAIPTHWIEDKQDTSEFHNERSIINDCEQDLYHGEPIEVELVGNVQRRINQDVPEDLLPFIIKFDSTKKNKKSMIVEPTEHGDAVFRCRFLRRREEQCNTVCLIAFNLSENKQPSKVEPLEFFGVLLDDRDLNETPSDVLADLMGYGSLHAIAIKAQQMCKHGEWTKSFYQSLSHSELEDEAFNVLVDELSKKYEGAKHVREKLEAGRTIVTQVLDKSTAKKLSEKIGADYVKLGKALDISEECKTIQNQAGQWKPQHRCNILLQTWMKQNGKKATLHVLMHSLVETGCKKGMEELLKHYRTLWDSVDSQDTKTVEDDDEEVVTSQSSMDMLTSETEHEEHPAYVDSPVGSHVSSPENNSEFSSPLFYSSLCLLAVLAGYMFYRYSKR